MLANLESGRRGTVSAAELLVLAAALDVAPIELVCPVGFDHQAEMLPGRKMDPLAAMRWFTGELKLETTGDATTLRQPARDEQSSTYLLEYHDELISRLRSREAEAARAVADAAAMATRAANPAEVPGDADGEDADLLRASIRALNSEANHLSSEANYRVANLAEWRDFIREPLRQTRSEMRRRGMMLPDLPADIQLDLGADDDA